MNLFGFFGGGLLSFIFRPTLFGGLHNLLSSGGAQSSFVDGGFGRCSLLRFGLTFGSGPALLLSGADFGASRGA